jgi:hypothetical protein
MECIRVEGEEQPTMFLDDTRGQFEVVDADELRLLCHETLDD